MGGLGGPRFRRLTGRPFDESRREVGRRVEHLDAHLAERDWVVGNGLDRRPRACSRIVTLLRRARTLAGSRTTRSSAPR